MPVLSIVACRMLEDELAHLLSADRDVRELLLVDGMQALSLSAKLKAQSRSHLLLGLDGIAPHLQERKARKVGIFSGQCGGFPADLEHDLSDLHYYAHHKGTKCTKDSQIKL